MTRRIAAPAEDVDALVDGFRAAALSALLGETGWADCLSLLAQGLPGGNVSMFVQTDRNQPLPCYFVTEGFDEIMQLYLRDFSAINPLWPGDPYAEEGRATADIETLPRDQLERTPYYQEFARHYPLRATAGMVIAPRPEESAAITLNMASTDPGDVLRARERLARAWPVLRQVVRHYRLLGERAWTAQGLAAQLEAAGCELLVVGQGRALRFRAGPDHGAALHRCDPVSRALRLTDARADAALGELLRSDHAGRDTVQLEDARAQLTLVRHQGDAETRLFCGPTVSVLIDPRRGLSGRQRMNMMVRRFGLTHAERRALEGIVAGHSIDEMARLHALSPETIRSQVKSLLARTETGSQLELLRLYDRSTR